MDHNLLVSELQSLVVESKRRNPEVKEAGEHALDLLKGGPLNKDTITQHAEALLAPITLGCKTKVGKVIGISISALQRLVALGGVPTTSLPGVLQTINSVAGQAVEIQLKLLQTLLSILTHNTDVHDEVLGNALLLCFKLQDSRVSVVSSTAAATLRQAVMIIFDRITTDVSGPSIDLSLPTEPPTELKITPSVHDAFNVFSDLCLLTAGPQSGGYSLWGGGKEQKPTLLKLNSLQRTFGLELIESVLSGYEDSVKQRPELLFLLAFSLDPLLIKLLHDKPTFPIALRVCRLEFLLIRSFAEQLPSQVEGYLINLIRIGTGEGDGEEAKKESVPLWLRVLALEIFRGICGDGTQLQNIFAHFDQPDGPQLFTKLVSALGRLINEKPVLLGVGSQMHGLGISAADGNPHGGYLDLGIGMVASAASAGMTTVNSMMGANQSGGLGPHSAMKLRLIEQHDKAEAPPIPETYIYLLALQSLDAVAESIYVAAGQSAEPPKAIAGMAESAWPALLAALSYSIATNLSDSLFAEVLSALQDFTVACGLLGLNTPRDAFLSTLGKYAVPPPAVSAMQSYMDAPSTPRNNSVIHVDSLGLGALSGTPSGPPSLSERNLACLRSMVLTARILAASLSDAWHDVLEVLQNANFMLGAKKPNMTRRPTVQSPQLGYSPSKAGSDSGESRPEVFDDLDIESIQNAINVLFDSSRDLDDAAFTTFTSALCRLSSEMIGFDASSQAQEAEATSPVLLSPGEGKRRTSGINISNSIKSGERSFSLNKLRIVAVLNLSRLVASDPSVGWDAVTKHLLAVARHITAPTTLRVQASDTLQELLLGAIRAGKESRTQHQVFDVLVRQVDVYPISNTVATDHDVRSSGYQTLNQILESSGHSLEVGWQTIFNMLNNVCKDKESSGLRPTDSQLSISSSLQRPSTLSRSDANLVRIAFPSLNLICTDFLSSLDSASIRQCIACLGCYGRQKEDVNITLAAIGLLWNVSDAVQGNDKQLWLYLLTELLELGRDPRLEVRSSAMQTLFRCLELYGSTLDSAMWNDVFWKVISPLLDAVNGDESSVLAVTSTGTILYTFFKQLSALDSFEKVFARFLERVQIAFKSEPNKCVTAALKALEKTLSAVWSPIGEKPKAFVLNSTWEAFVSMAEHIQQQPYTQENLVALVRIAVLLHDQLQWNEQKKLQLSTILKSVITYDKSPEYRPDVDNMSPLQDIVAKLLAGSKVLGNSIILGDLAEFASLAFIGDTGGKVSYVALSKFGLPKLKEVFARASETGTDLYENGTVESIIGAYAIPIKLGHDCPPANKFGDDLPLWKTAMSKFVPVLQLVVLAMDTKSISRDRSDVIWAQIIDIFAGILLAESAHTESNDEAFILPILENFRNSVSPRLDKIPDHLVQQYAEILRKASSLYYFDVKVNGGTTAPAIPERSERIRYWAFDLLVAAGSRPAPFAAAGATGGRSDLSVEHVAKAPEGTEEAQAKEEDGRKVAAIILPTLIRRMERSLRCFIDDARLRGQMPLGRVREEELLYILRILAIIRIYSGTLPSTSSSSILTEASKSSDRAHLFHFYALLLEISFLRGHLPSMWMFPSEHAVLFGLPDPAGDNDEIQAEARVNGVNDGESEDDHMDKSKGTGRGDDYEDEEVNDHADQSMNAGTGDDLIEVGARDVARRCLEIVGEEMGLGSAVGA